MVQGRIWVKGNKWYKLQEILEVPDSKQFITEDKVYINCTLNINILNNELINCGIDLLINIIVFSGTCECLYCVNINI